MRHDTMSMLEKLGGGGKLSDSDLLQWANSKVPAKAGKILSLGDPSLGTGLFVLHLCDSVKSGVVDWDIVTQGENEADRDLMQSMYYQWREKWVVRFFSCGRTWWRSIRKCSRPSLALSCSLIGRACESLMGLCWRYCD